MGLPDLSIRRPVTIMMVYLGILILGVISWGFLPQEFYPPITFPQLTVKTIYKDAAPEEIELLITKPIEEIVGTVSGLRRINSISKEETSVIIAEFNWGTNMDFAALHVREKIDLIKEKLPRGAEDPVVLKFNPFERPVMVLNVTGGRTSSELLEICKKQVKSELEKVQGVAAAILRGGLEREILVEVDQGRLGARGIPIVKVSEALSKSNLNFPAGTIEEEFYEYLVRAMGEFKVAGEMRDVVVGVEEKALAPGIRERPDVEPVREEARRKERETERRLIYLKDIAVVKDTLKERNAYSRYNLKETLTLSIQKQAGTHTLAVAGSVKKALARIRKDLPKDVKIEIAFDQSTLVSTAVSGVRDAAVLGGILAVVILYLFLRSLRSSLIVATTIPISILATFSLMYFGGLTINMISLGGLALGVGMLVDNGIVTVENVFRHRQLGKTPKEAAMTGTDEVVGAVTSSTLTTVAVFLPMVFVIGVVGQVFKELAFTVTFSLMASLFVALTLVPILAMSEKKELVEVAEAPAQGWFGAVEKKFRRLNAGLLNWTLANKGFSLLIVFVIFLLSVFVLMTIDREFLPKVDQGQFSIRLNMPPGTRLEVTDRIAKRIENILFALDEVKSVTMNVGSEKEELGAEVIETLGSNQAEALVLLKPKARFFQKGKGYRVRKTSEVLQDVKDALENEKLEGGYVEYTVVETEFQSAFQAGAPVVIEIKGKDLDILKKLAQDVKREISRIKGVYGVKDSIVPPSPETKVFVLKDKAASFNLSVSDIALTAQTGMKGYVATKMKQAGKEIDVRVRLRKEDRADLSKVKRLLVHSPLGMDLPLSDIAAFSVGKGPTEIRRLGQQRCVIVSANIFRRGLGEVIKDVNAKFSALKAPAGYTVALSGEYEQMGESYNSLIFAMVLAILAVYMIMAAQFESLWQPFVILFTFPLSIIGVAMALFVTKTPLSVMAMLGIIILGGVVVNNGIVLIDFANQRRAKGLSAYDAIAESTDVRLRPILMTALTTIFGLIPLALGLSEGTEIQIPMAITVMGGLTISTFLTLNIIPAIYLSAEEIMAKFRTAEPQIATAEAQKKEIEAAEGKIAEVAEKKAVEVPEKVAEKIPSQEPPKPQEEEIATAEAQKKEIEAAEKVEEIKPAEKVEEIKPSLPEKETELNPRQKMAIEYLKEKGKISRKEYLEQFNCSVATAARDLKELVDRGLIIGKGPLAIGRYYELKK